MMLNSEIVHLAKAEGGISAQVDFVEIAGDRYVLKTDTEFNLNGEKLFQHELASIGLPHIKTYEHTALKPNQMLMEYIDAETINGKNFTNANLTKLGETLSRVHKRKFDKFQRLDSNGTLQIDSWTNFVNEMAAKAKKSDYKTSGITNAIEKAAIKLIEQSPSDFGLCHGDVHGNNVFCKADAIILFDNNADAIVCTPHYDFAVLFGEVLTGYRYGDKFAQGPHDSERMRALLDGYGELPHDFNEYIDSYIFLRLLARYPNKFIKHQDDIIEMLSRGY